VYKELYQLGKKLPKQDRYGMHRCITEVCLKSLKLAIEAALSVKQEKAPILKKLRVEIGVLKQLVRLLYELNRIPQKAYFGLEQQLCEISKMAGGWSKYADMHKTKGA